MILYKKWSQFIYILTIRKKTMFKFSKKDEINNILFTSDKDYFITSMKYFTKLDDDLIGRKESKKNPKTIQNI